MSNGAPTRSAARERAGGALLIFGVAAIAALALVAPGASQADEAERGTPVAGSCTPLDVAFVIDVTGSMGGAIDNVKAGLSNILADANVVGAGNVRFEVISHEDDVRVLTPFAPNNDAAAATSVASLGAGGGGSIPEASDEAIRTAVSGLAASARPGGEQIGDAVPFRPEAQKILIYVGDALPAGFDDTFTPGVDDANAITIANTAAAAGIRINMIYVSELTPEPGEREYYQGMAAVTGGQFVDAGADGEGTAAGIEAAVNACGLPPQVCKGKNANVRGTDGNDTLVGTGGPDVFAPGAGNDKINGKGGKDTICVAAGNDKVKGGGGKDKVYGGGGKDKISGGGGKDTLKGGGGKDKLTGGPGEDKLKGGPGKDIEIQ